MHHAKDFHREIVSEMGELGVLGPTIQGKQKYLLILTHVIIITFPICGIALYSPFSSGAKPNPSEPIMAPE